jgi:hypothetical protein
MANRNTNQSGVLKKLSSHAATAKAIRTELKKHGIPGRVTAKSYSGGDSVTVQLQNEPPWTVSRIKAFAGQFEMGHFDGMVDCYEYSNRREDIPQVKFVFVENDFSDELRQKAYAFLRDHMQVYTDYPERLDEANNLRGSSGWVTEEVWQVLNGSFDSRSCGLKFWIKPRVKLVAGGAA